MRRWIVSALLVILTTGCYAQMTYSVGDRVIFDYHQVPTEGEIIRIDGGQYVIRWKGEYGENQSYYEPAKILRRADQNAPNPENAKGGAFAPGQKVLLNYHGDWVEAEILRKDGAQYVVRHQTPFGPAQAYYEPEKLKPLGKQGPATPQNATPAPNPTATVQPAGGGGLMSESELKAYLEANLGGNPWAPNRAAVLDELRRQIMTRGVNWHYSTQSPLYQDTVGKFGLTSDITRPLDDNFGPNPTRDALFGTWRTEVNGPTTYSTDGARVYRHDPIHATTGSLTINPGGSYSWTVTNGQVVQGRWRPATTAEMQYTGGEGLVLTAGRGGQDWIVTKFRDPVPAGYSPNWINIFELTTRQERQFGNR